MASLMWFRRDLRLTDNPAWATATNHGPVTACFVLDPRLWTTAGPHRGPQLIAHLRALDRDLRIHGGRLLILEGDPVEILPRAAGGHDAVFANRDVTPYALRRDRAIDGGVDVSWHDGSYVVPPGKVTTQAGDPYQVFTPFYRRWLEVDWPQWPPETAPAAVGSNPGSALPESAPPLMEGGEDAARRRLETFAGVVDGYPHLRDRPDLDQTSRLSADLKFGTLGPRTIIEALGTGTQGRDAFVRQLAWREFYAQILLARPDMARRALRPEYDRIEWENDESQFVAWTEGRTGYPIVDAGMRQLAAEGWMHNRVRMITASFLVKDLLVDWRRGERFFRHLLVDGDIPQNAGNWQWVAGTGADAAPYFRVFNPVTQSRKFDPDGDYIRRYVPELAGVAAPAIHTPWDAPGLELAAAGVTLGETYPLPVVDHAEARLRTLAAYEAARS